MILWTNTNKLYILLKTACYAKFRSMRCFVSKNIERVFWVIYSFEKKIQKQSDIGGTGSYSFQHLFCFVSRNNDKYKITFHTVWNCFDLGHMHTWTNITVEVISKERCWLIDLFTLIVEVSVQLNRGRSLYKNNSTIYLNRLYILEKRLDFIALTVKNINSSWCLFSARVSDDFPLCIF